MSSHTDPKGTYNPGNFANRSEAEVEKIAAMGGAASHGGGGGSSDESKASETAGSQAGRNPDGTFTKGSDVASELGKKGGETSH